MKKKWYWITEIVIIILIAIFILIFLTKNVTVTDTKNELLQKMNTVVQTYNISSYEYYIYTSHDASSNQSVSVKDGKLIYLKEEFILYWPQETVCKKEFKNENWIECSCDYPTYCNYTSVNPDFERKEKYLDSIKQLGEFNISKNNTTKQRTCYTIIEYDDFNKRYEEGNTYCFNEENLIVNADGVINDAVYQFYIEGYSSD